MTLESSAGGDAVGLRTDREPVWTTGWRAVVILVLTAVVPYLPVLLGGYGFIWDDPDYVVNNANLRGWEGLVRTWTDLRSLPQWYPLVHTTFWLEYQAWGLWATGYHAVNVGLHAVGAVVLWRVLLRLGLGAWGSLLGAVLWSVHPVQVESVAWITERKNTLSFVFYMLAGLWLLRWGGVDAGAGLRPARSFGLGDVAEPAGLRPAPAVGNGAYVLGVLFFVLALLSKTVSASLPAAYLLVVYWKRGRVSWRGDVGWMVPLFLMGAAAGQVTAYLERVHVGALGAEWGYGFVERCLIAGRAVVFYVWTLSWPVGLSFIYPRWEINAGVWWQWVFPVGVVTVLLGLWVVRGRIGRGPWVALAFFVGTLFPALGFFNVYPHRYSFVADHFQHLASVGLIAVAAVWMARWPKAVGVAVVGVLMVLSGVQTRIYRDSLTLWLDTERKNPGSWMVQINLELAHRELKRAAKTSAEREYHNEKMFEAMLKARELGPGISETHWNAGVAMMGRERWAEAREAFEAALAVDGTDVLALTSLAQLEMREEKWGKAEALLLRVVGLEKGSGYGKARGLLGEVLLKQNRVEEAARQYAAAVSVDGKSLEYRATLARVVRRLGVAAADPLEKARLLDAAAGHYLLAIHLADEARSPGGARLRLELGQVLAVLGRTAEGEGWVREALRIDPSLETGR